MRINRDPLNYQKISGFCDLGRGAFALQPMKYLLALLLLPTLSDFAQSENDIDTVAIAIIDKTGATCMRSRK